jgi:phosphoribosylanthranilate isomerase
MTTVKICGINGEAAFDAAVEAGADWLGFVFFPPSPRYVTPLEAAMLSARHAGRPLRAGLFVEPRPEEIQAVLDAMPLDALQIYAGSQLCQELQEKFGVPVWRAVGVKSRDDLPVTADGLSRYVIEGKAPEGATRPGGNAVTIDWTMLGNWQAPLPWILAGGLTPENVAQAINITGAPAVDVSSGVETAPGVKSPALIRQFIANARGALERDRPQAWPGLLTD